MGEPRRVLVVDGEAAMRELLVSLLEEAGIRAHPVASAEEALESARATDFDAVVSDIRMPERGGIALLAELRQAQPETPVILTTAFGSIDSAVDAMRGGAFDFITKPFKRAAVLASLERAFELRALEQENRRLRCALDAVERPERGLLAGALEKQMSLRELSDLYTERVLALVHGNKVRAARILGINRRTLYRRGGSRGREAVHTAPKETN